MQNDCARAIHHMKTKFLLFTFLTVTLNYATSALAQLPPEARAGLWKAQWITSPSAPQRDIVVLHFRKVIEVPRAPEHFVVHVSADSQFILCVNQREDTSASKAMRCCATCWWKQRKQRRGVTQTGDVGMCTWQCVDRKALPK